MVRARIISVLVAGALSAGCGDGPAAVVDAGASVARPDSGVVFLCVKSCGDGPCILGPEASCAGADGHLRPPEGSCIFGLRATLTSSAPPFGPCG